tara:strand:- start:6124 stop:6432 length:309 start_codon:yes stop_codon:yes gene_type:complete
MPLIVRQGDDLTTGHACTSITQLDTPTQGTVFVRGKLAARIGDPTVSHPNPPVPLCPNHVAVVNAGSSNVYVVGIKVGRLTDSADAGNMVDAKNNTNVYANG